MQISEIIIGARARHHMGDIAGLAQSIREHGLLQPIGVRPDKQLVFGLRRLIAARDYLKWTVIDTREINIDAIVFGEYAENEIRKDYTPSERVAICNAVEKQLGDRRSQKTGSYRENSPGITGRARDIAAKRAGFGNEFTARQAKYVVKHAEPELIEAMDTGLATINGARLAADLPAEAQKALVVEHKASGQKIKGKAHAHKAKGAPPIKSAIINPPSIARPLPKREEIEGYPPEGAGFEAHRAYLDQTGFRVHIHSTAVRDLLKANAATSDIARLIMQIASPGRPDAEAFFSALDKLLYYQPVKGATDGAERNFAKLGQESLAMMVKHIEAAALRLDGYLKALKARQAA
jgi:ParB family chromosome partitioning protein